VGSAVGAMEVAYVAFSEPPEDELLLPFLSLSLDIKKSPKEVADAEIDAGIEPYIVAISTTAVLDCPAASTMSVVVGEDLYTVGLPDLEGKNR